MNHLTPPPQIAPTAPSDQAAPARRHRGRRMFWFLAVLVSLLAAGELFARLVVEPRRGVDAAAGDVQVERQLKFIRDLTDDDPTDPDIDVVVAGTSMAGVGLDPQIIGDLSSMNIFNASIGCGNPMVMSDWLPNHVGPQLNPDVVVLAVSPTDFDAEACPRSWTPINDLLNPVEPKLYKNPRLYIQQNSALWRNRSWLRGINNLPQLITEPDWVWDVSFRSDGFWQVDDWAPTDPESFLLNPNRKQIRLDDDFMNALRSTIVDLRAQGIDVVISEMPMAQRWINHLSESTISYRQAQLNLEQIALESGAEFIPADPSLHKDTWFIDEGHMTPSGTAAYSVWLAENLVKFNG